jgi:AcrR family transcriptional regulator
MPYQPERKQQTRRRIVRSARQLFNRRGFTEVSIDEIMAGAGLTRGGFYAHFKNKEELFSEAVTLILEEHPVAHWQGFDLDMSSEDIARIIVNAYLSDNHFDDIEASCPMIALPSDVARGGAQVQQAFRSVLLAMVQIFRENLSDDEQSAESTALAIASLCVGGMVLARSVGDKRLGDNIRAASRALALRTGGWENPTVS